MTENEAIYCLKAESDRYSEVCEECPLYGKVGCDHCFEDAIDVAIKSLEELQMYKQGGLCLIPSDAYKKQCEELDAYKEIGTVEELQELKEKSEPKKPNWGEDDQDYITCSECKEILGAVDGGEYNNYQEYCPNCGQKLDWQ